MAEGVPQLEDGFTRIANEILESIARTPLSDYESRCVHFLWRKTYGWKNPDGESKKFDFISHTQWSNGTGIPRRHVADVLTRLGNRKIFNKEVVYQGKRRMTLWGFQKRYKEWLSPKQVTGKAKVSPKEGTHQIQSSPKEGTHQIQSSPKQGTAKAKMSPKEVTSRVQLSPICDRLSPKQGTELSPKQGTTKDNKDKVQKKCIYTAIFDFWNSLQIIQHKQLTDKMRRTLKSALQNYTQGEICQAMKNYVEILNSDDYFFSYRWTLEDFLRRGLEKFMDGEVARQNYTIREERIGEQSRKGVRPKPRQERARPITYIKGSGEDPGRKD